MGQHTLARYLNGFIIGVVFGVLLVFSGITLYNLYCSWTGCAPLAFSWGWRLLPLPVVLGICMAFFVAKYTLRD